MIAKRRKRKGLFGALFVLAVLLVCGCDQNKTTFEWGGRTSGSLVTIVNDSLALLQNVRGSTSCQSTAMNGDMCEDGGDHTGLFLVNYRNKQAPLWGDTLDYYLGAYGGYYSDSSVMFLDEDDQFCFWKIGGKPTERKPWTWTGSCSPKLQGTKRARPWKDGNILILGGWIPQDNNSCQYALLDTSTGVVSQGRFSDDDSWLAACDDINYFNGKVACLKKDTAFACAVDLIVGEVPTDTLVMDSCKYLSEPIAKWLNNYIRTNVYRTISDWKYSADRLYKVDVSSMTFDDNYSELWFKGAYEFIQEGLSIVDYYDSEDLIVTGGKE